MSGEEDPLVDESNSSFLPHRSRSYEIPKRHPLQRVKSHDIKSAARLPIPALSSINFANSGGAVYSALQTEDAPLELSSPPPICADADEEEGIKKNDAHLSRSPSIALDFEEDGVGCHAKESGAVSIHGSSLVLDGANQIPVLSADNPRRRYARNLALLTAVALISGIFAWKHNEITRNSRPRIWDAVFNASATNASSSTPSAAPPVPSSGENAVRARCTGYYSCYSCANWEGCGWCPYSGRCTRGSQDGSYDGQCSQYSGDWVYYQEDCATPCSAGTYSSNGWSPCSTCPAGSYQSSSGSTTCYLCAVGSFSSSGQAACDTCQAGTYQNAKGSSDCYLCSAGTYSGTGQSSCTTCTPGFYQPYSGQVSCPYQCPAGTFSSSGQSQCTSCLPGSYQGSIGQSSCLLCAAGTYSLSGQTSCTVCPPGTYQSRSGQSICTPCSPGSYSSSGQTACSLCSPGSYSAVSQVPTRPCQPPRLQDGSVRLSGCQTSGCRVEVFHNNLWGSVCDDGFTDREASVICRSLGAQSGSFIERFGGGSGTIWLDDVVCPSSFVGFIGDCDHSTWGYNDCSHSEDVGVCCSFINQGATSCDSCTAGQYQPNYGSSVCSSCPAGTYQSYVGSSACRPCAAGAYSGIGQTSCNLCPSGTYQSRTGQSICVLCPVGTYSGSGQISCSAIPQPSTPSIMTNLPSPTSTAPPLFSPPSATAAPPFTSATSSVSNPLPSRSSATATPAISRPPITTAASIAPTPSPSRSSAPRPSQTYAPSNPADPGYQQLSVGQCCDCSDMAMRRASVPDNDFSKYLNMNCVVPTAQCRSKDVVRCSAALASKLFDGSEVRGRQSSDEYLQRMCDSDCRSVLGISSTMTSATTLAGGDVATSVLGMVMKIAMIAGVYFEWGWTKLFFPGIASLITSLVQITIESVFLTRYRNGGSEQWLTGCEVLSSCSMNQGPASAMSQIYNGIDSLMSIVWFEIWTNAINFCMTCVTLVAEYQTKSPAAHGLVHYVVLGLEFIIDIGQVIASSIAVNSLKANISPVDQLTTSLIGKYTESAALCLLPCCAEER